MALILTIVKKELEKISPYLGIKTIIHWLTQIMWKLKIKHMRVLFVL